MWLTCRHCSLQQLLGKLRGLPLVQEVYSCQCQDARSNDQGKMRSSFGFAFVKASMGEGTNCAISPCSCNELFPTNSHFQGVEFAKIWLFAWLLKPSWPRLVKSQDLHKQGASGQLLFVRQSEIMSSLDTSHHHHRVSSAKSRPSIANVLAVVPVRHLAIPAWCCDQCLVLAPLPRWSQWLAPAPCPRTRRQAPKMPKVSR